MSLIHATSHSSHLLKTPILEGAQWLSGRVLDSRPKGRRFEPHRRHCVVSLSKNNNPSLVLVQPRKTRPFITERLLMGRKESNQTNKKHQSLSQQRQMVVGVKRELVAKPAPCTPAAWDHTQLAAFPAESMSLR